MQFSTTVLQFVDGSEQRFCNYQAALHRWVIQLSLLDQSELQQLQEFFRGIVGRAGDFAFTDPLDGAELSKLQLGEREHGGCAGGRMEWRDVADCTGERKLTCSTIRSSPLGPSPSFQLHALSICEQWRINFRAASRSGWQIPVRRRCSGGFVYSDLTDGERSSIESLFEAAEGQLNTFTFLDPTDNLLMWSEDWTQAVWTADPLLQVTGGVSDPLGGSAAMQLTNTAQTTQQIIQNTSGPSSFVYCYSVYVRSAVPATIQLVVTATGQTALTPVTTGTSWMRVTAVGSLSVQQDGVGFGVQLPAGVQVDVFGAQVEAQPGAGLYKKTIDLGGVYSSTRLSSDLLAVTATATQPARLSDRLDQQSDERDTGTESLSQNDDDQRSERAGSSRHAAVFVRLYAANRRCSALEHSQRHGEWPAVPEPRAQAQYFRSELQSGSRDRRCLDSLDHTRQRGRVPFLDRAQTLDGKDQTWWSPFCFST